ncbi:NAD(P)/FAD-dependent oxidoreductase [Weissella diestrammenae]|uniref:NADH:ubiquinone reductase (non-electrogenic) n=1 Tax=Weissella diestrammenae TaxID=1162633 RepID=A0A7G9T3I1_9LACO|nr:NAD(P)/FAD-dependent oxidoreductase [Weissella diestrammenae]MCM0582627.1 NAD(P)/FAD-dependent oxidoreductase [Weissella diestrammenae]QNN74656.1 NAD(P)/FAD-dependent oxidoreductase [Weissella diestrammenae]
MTKNIVIVGAGFAGVMTARKLARQLSNKKEYQIVLIDEHPFFTYRTSLHEVATKRIEPSDVQFDLRQLFIHQKNVKIVTANVTAIDKTTKIAETSTGSVPFEKLVIATGGQADADTPGASEFGYTLWTLNDAVRLRSHIEETVRQAAIELDPVVKKTMLNMVIVGAGFTGVQLAGDLLDERKELAAANNLSEHDIKVTLIEAESDILRQLGQVNLANKAEAYLAKQGANVLKNTRVVQVKAHEIILSDGTIMPTETLMWAAGVKAKDTLDYYGLETNEQGRFFVDDYSRIVGQENIYAVGDVATYQELARTNPDDPTTGWTIQNVDGAVSGADTAVANLVFDLTGKGTKKRFKGRYNGFVVTVGAHYGVAFVRRHISLSGFLASEYKHWSNIGFLLTLGSFYQVFQYLLREFFRTPHQRTSTQGNSSNMGNTLWTVPLRLITGIYLMITGAAIGGGFGMLFAGVGVALFLGFFTSIAGFLTMLLSFVMMGMSFSISALLLPFVGIALMNGVGRSFGLDHWVMPWVMKTIGTYLNGESKSSYNDLNE